MKRQLEPQASEAYSRKSVRGVRMSESHRNIDLYVGVSIVFVLIFLLLLNIG